MATGYYDEDFAPWVAGIRSLGSMITRQPALNAQAQDRAMQTELAGARIGTEQAQGKKYDAETANLVRKGQLVTLLETHGAQAQADLAAGRTDTPAVKAFVSASSALTGLNGDDIAANMKQGLGTLLARQGDVRGAAGVQNPNTLLKTEADIASREKLAKERPTHVAPGSALWQDGKIIYQQPSAANEEYEQTTEVFPAEAPTEGSPAVPEKYGWFGRKVSEAIPATPGTPGKPERRVVTRRKLGSAVTTPQPAANGEHGTDLDDDGATEAAEGDVPESTEQPVTRPDDASTQALLKEANDAIARGADRAKVIERLKKKFGITVTQ